MAALHSGFLARLLGCPYSYKLGKRVGHLNLHVADQSNTKPSAWHSCSGLLLAGLPRGECRKRWRTRYVVAELGQQASCVLRFLSCRCAVQARYGCLGRNRFDRQDAYRDDEYTQLDGISIWLVSSFVFQRAFWRRKRRKWLILHVEHVRAWSYFVLILCND